MGASTDATPKEFDLAVDVFELVVHVERQVGRLRRLQERAARSAAAAGPEGHERQSLNQELVCPPASVPPSLP
jgi:hypothetical protein